MSSLGNALNAHRYRLGILSRSSWAKQAECELNVALIIAIISLAIQIKQPNKYRLEWGALSPLLLPTKRRRTPNAPFSQLAASMPSAGSAETRSIRFVFCGRNQNQQCSYRAASHLAADNPIAHQYHCMGVWHDQISFCFRHRCTLDQPRRFVEDGLPAGKSCAAAAVVNAPYTVCCHNNLGKEICR